MLSTMEMLAFEEKLEATGGKDSCRSVLKTARELLNASMNEALLWQDRPQRFVEVGHSNATLTLTEVVSADQRALCDHSNRLRQKALEERYVEDNSAGSMDDDNRASNIKRHNSEIMGPPIGKPKRARLSGGPPVLRIDSASFRLLMKKKPQRHNSEIMGPPVGKPKRARLSGAPPVLRIDSASFRLLMKKKPQRHNSEIMGPPVGKPKRARLSGAPPVLRIDSASFRLLMKKKPQLSAKNFISRIVETTAYNERKKRITEVLDKLRILLRI
uniref:Uncharacterized protein n=1 Tax=Ascaris lumbricoides TaxID=6252 RepID=A0A0M3IQ09_ASCLU